MSAKCSERSLKDLNNKTHVQENARIATSDCTGAAVAQQEIMGESLEHSPRRSRLDHKNSRYSCARVIIAASAEAFVRQVDWIRSACATVVLVLEANNSRAKLSTDMRVQRIFLDCVRLEIKLDFTP